MDFKRTQQILLFFYLVIINFHSHGQIANLELSRVVTIDTTITCTGCGCVASSAAWVVPSGKVWKVQFLSSAFDDSYRMYWRINGVSIAFHHDGSTGQSTGVFSSNSLWLKSGDSIEARMALPSNFCGMTTGVFFSALEFNLN